MSFCEGAVLFAVRMCESVAMPAFVTGMAILYGTGSAQRKEGRHSYGYAYHDVEFVCV